MPILSQTAEYALRALVFLAEGYPSGPIRVDDIAEALGVPRNYLSKILHALAKAGVLSSTRGPSGGFELVRPPEELPLLDVVREFEPSLASEDRVCLLGRDVCSDEDPCSAHEHWGSVRSTVTSFFRETTLDRLVRERAGPASTAGRRSSGRE